jgi:hypothetical protein
VKIEQFVSDRMSYLVLRDGWCDIVVGMHGATKDISTDSKDSFCEELEQVIEQFVKYHMKFC